MLDINRILKSESDCQTEKYSPLCKSENLKLMVLKELSLCNKL